MGGLISGSGFFTTGTSSGVLLISGMAGAAAVPGTVAAAAGTVAAAAGTVAAAAGTVAAAAATGATLGTVAVAGGSMGVIGAGLAGSGAYVGDVLQQYLIRTTEQYVKILSFIAETLGIKVDTVQTDPYSLEKEISCICSSMLRPRLPKDSSLVLREEDLANFSPTTKCFIENLNETRKKQYLSVLTCINANFQIRELLSQDFAVGVIGTGKTGKSTLIRNMFGCNTNPSNIVRTEDLRSYRVNDHFRVVDFPHSTDVFSHVKNCFQFNHTFVNALIVVLNAEQTGRDANGEQSVVNMVKNLTKDTGVDVLYCFNKCDKLALEIDRPRRTGGGNLLKSIREGKLNQSIATTVQHKVSVQLTDEENEKRKLEWSNRKAEWGKHYGLEPDECLLTFCNDDSDDEKFLRTYVTLRKLDLYSPLEIKEEWLRNVLIENDVPDDRIETIMKRFDE